ncbi:MAG TPA: Ig-like domain-containing protein [Gaiellaceae bacterium]|nr:Ig-like domain-containing protein [Gaiellaceae bacterium]
MTNFPELRPGERSAEAERVAVLRSASPVRLAALAALAAAVFMAVLQLGGATRSGAPPAFLEDALGAAESEAPLVRHPQPGVELAIDDSSFRIRSRNATVTLSTQGAEAGDWHHFENGVSRPTAVGAETILVDGPTLEQFLTIRERQGLRTWHWKIDTAQIPRVGDDGAVAFLDTKLHKLTDVSIAPVAILDAQGDDITPNGLRWGVEQRNGSWWLTLRLDDSGLPLPYVIDPAVTHRATLTGTQASGTSVTVNKPAGVQANDLLVAHVMVTGNVTSTVAGSGWTAVASGTSANQATQASFYKIAGGSEPASYSFTWTGAQAAAATVTAYYGVKSSAPLDLPGTVVSTNNTTTVTANSITTTANDDIVLAFFGSASNSTYTPPTGWNERGDVNTTGISASTADKIQVTAGATGNASATSTVSARVYAHQAAFHVDDVAPSVTLSDPGSPVTGTITLQTSAASDADSYVASVQFQRSPAGAGTWTNVGAADTTSPYSVSFDTTAVGDGLYDLRAVATDGAGNTANSATISNRRIDNNAPTSTTTFPSASGTYNAAGWNAGCATNGFCGTYGDGANGSGVQKVEISIRQGAGNYWSAGSFSSASEVWNTTSLSAGNWSYTFPASSFPADGSYTIRVRATDNVSLVEAPASRSFTIDTAAPNTSITANPADPTTSTSASFSFSSTEGGSTFECQLDGGGYTACTSPKSYAGPLSDGSHSFQVRSTDGAGNTDGSAASYTWTVDTAEPSSTTTFPGSGATYSTSGWNGGCATNGFCGTYSDGVGGSGVQKVEISIRQGAGNYWSAGSFSSASEVWNTTSLSAGNWSYTFPASSFPADGSYTIRVRATDNVSLAESPSSRSFTIDRTAPNTTIDSNPSDPTSSTSASFSFSSTEGGSTFACQLDGGGYSACTSPKSYAGPLGQGSHTFTVRATDGAGNTDGTPATYTWTVDSVAPSSATTFPASAANYTTSGWNAGCATIGFCGTYSDATSGVQKVEISIRQGSGNYWSAGSFSSAGEVWNTASLSGGNWSYAFSAASFPADGSYTIRVRATDNATNVESPSSRSFSYDATAPNTIIDSNPADPSSSANASFTFSSTEGSSTFECELDGGGFSSCSSPKSYSSLAEGSHTFKVRATDQAGNTDATPAQFTWTVDTVAPATTIDSSPSLTSNSAAATFTFSSTEGSSTFECELDGGGFSSCSSPKNYSGLAEGSHTFKVRATDQAGNVDATPAQFTWTVDTVNPSAVFTFPASGANYDGTGWGAGCATAGFCGTYSDATSGVQGVEISIRQGTGNYWNGTTFGSATEVFQTATTGGGDWSYAFPASSFPAGGSYTVHVRATDNAGNTETGPSRTFTYDTTPPETTIDSNPSDPSTSADATFTFSADEGGSTFACELDGGGFSACTSPKNYSSLAEGSHTFKVRSTDGAGNTDPTPAQFTWTVDTVAPSSTTSFPASGGKYNASGWDAGCATVGFCGTYSDATSGVQKVEISIRRGSGNYWNGSAFASAGEVWNLAGLSGGDWSYALSTTDFPADGSYTIRVKATDNAGNGETPASRSFTYDTADPSALFSFPASGGDYANAAWDAGCATAGFCGTYSDTTAGVQAVEISIRRGSGNYWNGTSFGSASEVFQTASLSGGNWSYDFAAAGFPADGSYTVHVRATDNASNTEPGPSRTFRIDNANPSAAFSFPASGGAYADSGWNAGCATSGFCGTYSDATSGVQAVDVSIRRVGTGLYWNGSAFSSGSEDFQAASLAGGNWTYALPASSFPADGSYTVHIRATDNAGNSETGPSRSFTIDNVAPNAAIDSGPSDPSASADATFEFSADEGGSTFECELDGGGFSACTSPKTYTSLSDGSHTFKVRSTDAAGNTDATPAELTWSVDTAAPSSSVSFPGAGAFYHTSTWNAGCTPAGFCGTYSDATSGVQKVELSIKRLGTGLYWNGSAFSSGSELFFTTALSAGDWSYAFGAASFPVDDDYTVRVKATDNADNAESPSTRTFTFDATDPTGSLTAPANGAAVSGNAVTVSSDSADAGSGVALATFERRPSGGGSWTTIATDGSAPYSVDWDTTALADGDYDLRVTTDDESGNSFSSATRTVTVDNTNPSSATLDALPGAISNGQALTGSGADSGSGVASLSYYFCPGPPCSPSTLIGSSSTGPSYSVTWSSQPADGDYQVLVRVADRAGNTLDSTKQTVTVDNTDPTGSLTAPADTAQVSGTVAVSSDSDDSGSGVASAAFQRRPAGGGSWTTIATDTTDPYSVSWDTTPLGDGDYDLRVLTTDAAGNSFSSATRTVSVDNHAPTVSITAPGAYVNGAAADPFTVTATSPDTDIASVEFFVCDNQSANCSTGSWDSLGAPDTTAPYTASWDVLGDGNQALRAIITDNASNTGSDVVSTLVDRTDPTGSVTSPTGGAFLSGTVSVSSDSDDAGSGAVSALFERRPAGGGTWTAIDTDTSSPYSVSWDTSALNGDFDLHVVTTDAAGNTHTSAALTVTVDSTAPSAPVISLSESSPHAFVSGQTIFVDTGQSGSYDVSATSSDAQSGIEKIRFPGGSDDFTSPYEASYGFGALSGSQTVTSYNGSGLTASDTFTVTPDTTGPSAFSLTAPGAGDSIADGQTVSASPGDAGSGIDTVEFRYCAGSSCSFSSGTAIGAPDSAAPYSVAWSGQPADGTYTIVARATDNVGNATDSAERTVSVDNTGPSSVLSVNEGTRSDLQYFDSATDTYYYNPAATGDFTLHDVASDPAGVASVDFAAIADTGFSGSAKSDTSFPYDSNTYTFTTGSASAPATQAVVVTDALGNATNDSFDLVRDVTAPTGGSVTYTDGYDADGDVVVSTADGNDTGAGVDGSSGVLERRTSALTDGSCGSFSGGWTPVTSPDSVTSGECAQYRYRVFDRVGNEAIYTSGSVVQVDLSAPSGPALTLSESSAWAFVSGTTVYLNTAQAGSYDVDATTDDAQSGIDQVSFPAGQDDATSPYQATYAFGDLSGSQTVTAENGAGLTASSSFTVTSDTAAPTGGSVTYADGYDADGQVTISTSDGNDALSGVDASSGILESRTSALSDGSCAGFAGGWTTVTSPDTVATGTCAQYRYRVSDNVGNEAVYSSGNVVKVDTSGPATPVISLSESSPHAFVSGQTIFVDTGQSGSYDVSATSSDAQSGIEKIRFPGTTDDFTSPYEASYGFGALSGSQTVTAYSNAGLTASDTFTVTPDTTDPSTTDDTGTIGSAWRNAPVTVTLSPSDGGAGLAATYYTTDGSVPTTSSAQGTSVDLTSNGVYTVKYFSVDRVGNAEPVQTASTQIRIDQTDPSAPALTLGESSPYAHVVGTTIYVQTGQSGTYTVAATSNDPLSGIAKIAFPGGVDDSASPYQTIYALGDLAGTQTVTAHDDAGNTSSSTFDATADDDAPLGGSVTYADGYDADGQVTISTSNGTDALSGVDASSGVLERRTSALTDGTCAAFAGGWTTVTGPDTVATDTCAEYRYRVFDNVSNEAIYTSGNIVKVDQTAPNTSIGSTPGDPTNATGASFTFSATETGSTFECELDGGGFTSCTSPKSYAGLAEGSHTFKVRATDIAGNTDSSPAQFTWTVDTSEPNTSIGSTPSDPTSAADADFTFDSSEGGSTFECELDGGGFTSCTSPKSYSGLADGSHSFNVRSTDIAGNTDASPAQFTWAVDTSAPNTTIDVSPADPDSSPNPSFEFSSSEGSSTFECELDGGGFTSCTSPKSYSGLADGSHTFQVRSTDQAGNTDATPASYTWSVNAGAPTVSITAPSGFVNLADADPFTVSATSPDGDVAGVEFFSCSDASNDCSSGSWVSLGSDAAAPYTASWPLPADGNAALRAVATDVGTNTGEDVLNVTVDRTRPVTSIDSAPSDPTSATGASFDFSGSEGGVGFECRLDGGSFGPCASPKSYSSLAEGTHTFDVQATDAAGNAEATPQTHTWTVDTTAPDTSITATPSDPSASPSADFSFTSTEGGSSFECRLDGGVFAACADPASYTGLADGSHTFRVRATDIAGNTDGSAAVYTWTLDATAPGGGLTDPGSPLRRTVGLSASPSDSGVGVQQVVFQSSPADAGTWSDIAIDTTSPYTADWDTTGVADGLYDLRIVVTDNASNTAASAVLEDRLVDNTDPIASMDDPGAYLSGTVNLTSTTGDSGSGVASVTYQRSPAGANTWTTVSATWNTTGVADGLYDLRVRVTDNAGNATTSAAVVDRRVDNTAPALASSAPSDGSNVTAAGSLAVTANEDLADVFASDIDGSSVAGVATGATVTFTQAFAPGPHTLSGELEDLAGNRTPIRVHFTVWNTTGGDYPYTEKNSFASSAMTVAATNGVGQLHIPAGAWSGAPAGDWLVAKVDPQSAGAVASGFSAEGDVYDVSAYWALSGGAVTSFDEPIELTLTNGAGNVVPAFLNGSAWQPIARLSGTTLPESMQQGFYKDGDTVHLLTRSADSFMLLRDLVAPTKPKSFKGKSVSGRLVLSWKASTDSSGLVDAYLVYVNGTLAQTLGSSTLSVDMGAFSQKDARSFQVAARDAAGNVSAKTPALVVVPKVANMPLAKAKKALTKRGLKAGKLTYVFSSVPKGSVVAAGKSGLTARGSAVPLKVSKGRAARTSDTGSGTTTPPPAYQPPTYQPPTSPPPVTTPPSSAPPTDSPPTGGDPIDPTAGGAAGAGAAEPESFNQSEVSSARRTAGLVLLAGLFLGAGAMVLRARRRLIPPVARAEALDGPILFWDERLVRSTASALRRAFAALGR